MITKVSIIIPVYNVEQYLRQCIDSIGLLGHDDFEIIIVNDGSTDGSDIICREYEQKWHNVHLIEKSNGGLSDARNHGTAAAKGDYIYYLDSDDWLVPGAIEQLYRFAVENNCEVVQGGFYYAFDDHLEYDENWIKEDQEPFVLEKLAALQVLLKNTFIKNFAWGKIYKSSIVKSHEFPVGKFFEDSYWQHHVVSDVNLYGIIPKPLYFYRQRENSITGTGGAKQMDLLLGNEERLHFIRENYPELTSIAADTLWYLSFLYHNKGEEFYRYFDRFNSTYSSLLSAKRKRMLWYKLAKNHSSLLPYYLRIKRLRDHFRYKRPKRIEFPK